MNRSATTTPLYIARRLDALSTALGRFSRPLCEWGVNASAALLAIMLAIVMTQIASRTAAGLSFAWSEELSKTLMTWGALFAAPNAYRNAQQLRISMFVDALDHRSRRVISIAIALLIFWLSGALALHGAQMAADAMAVRASSLPVPAGVLYSPLPPVMILFMLISLESAARETAAAFAGAPEATN